jgi:hypothetical protein
VLNRWKFVISLVFPLTYKTDSGLLHAGVTSEDGGRIHLLRSEGKFDEFGVGFFAESLGSTG